MAGCLSDNPAFDTDDGTGGGEGSDDTTQGTDETSETSEADDGSAGGSGDGGTSSGGGESGSSDPSTSTSNTGDTEDTGNTGNTGNTGGSTGGGSPSVTCDMLFGDVPDYLLCDAQVDECSFNVSLDMMRSCDDVCGAVGGTCLSVQENGTMPSCTPEGSTSCGTSMFYNVICTCATP